MKQDIIRKELERIRINAGGFLRPADVVKAARDPNSPLHGRFTWDDTEAAHRYRLAEARALIRVAVIVSEETSEKVRAFVSLSTDREPDRGYRALAEVLDNEVLMDTLLRDAVAECAAFKRKMERYRELAQLNGVMNAVDDVVERHSRQEAEARISA